MTYLTNGFFILAQVPQTRTLTVDAQNRTLLNRTLLDSRQTSFHFIITLYCILPMIASMLPHAELEQNNHREDEPRFIFSQVM